MTRKITKTDQEWRKQLSSEAYHITREKGTEPAFTGEYCDNYEQGVYHCVCCGAKLFDAKDKYNSGSGWPSFTKPASKDATGEKPDDSLSRKRTEVICNQCEAHLGHVFSDGPDESTGLRYCINSAALKRE